MTQINGILQDFLNRNPDIRGARNKGLVNRRALAGYIARKEGISTNKIEAIVTALRRVGIDKEEPADLTRLFRGITITTKDKIAVVSLEKSDPTLQKIQKVLSKVSYAKNETLKLVEGSSAIKLYIDQFNLGKIRDIFAANEIRKIQKDIAEINMFFPETANKTKGIVAYVASQLAIEDINMVEMLTGTPELIIYVDENDLLKAYNAIQRMKRKDYY